MGLEVLVGADPELFIVVGGEIIPCVGVFPGTKESPSPVPNSRIGLTIQEDNVTLELGWSPTPIAKVSETVQRAYRETLELIGAKFPGAKIYTGGCYNEFAPKHLQSEQAQTFGCSPDMLAHQRGAVRAPVDPTAVENFRFTGGHVHIGYPRHLTPVPDWAIVQFMDLAYLMDVSDGKDRQGPRRKFYGLPGLYRRKEYGLEYRTPSNYWFTNYPSAPRYMANIAEAVINKPNFARVMHAEIPWELVAKSITEEGMHISPDAVDQWYSQLLEAPEEITAAAATADQQEPVAA